MLSPLLLFLIILTLKRNPIDTLSSSDLPDVDFKEERTGALSCFTLLENKEETSNSHSSTDLAQDVEKTIDDLSTDSAGYVQSKEEALSSTTLPEDMKLTEETRSTSPSTDNVDSEEKIYDEFSLSKESAKNDLQRNINEENPKSALCDSTSTSNEIQNAQAASTEVSNLRICVIFEVPFHYRNVQNKWKRWWRRTLNSQTHSQLSKE